MTPVRRCLAALTVITLAAGLLVAAPVSATPALERDGDHFPTSVDVTIPPGSSATVTTPGLSKGTDLVRVIVKTHPDASAEADEGFAQLTHFMGTLKTKGKRLMACLMIHKFAVKEWRDDLVISEEGKNDVLSLLLLMACLEIAGLLTDASAARPAPAKAAAAAAAARGCARRSYDLPASLEKTRSGYRLTVDGQASRTKKPKIKAGCRVKGGRIIYTVRAAKKGTSLRKAVGKKFSIGLQSPTDAETSVPVRVTFDTR